MYILKAFAANGAYTDNTLSVTATIGELSPVSKSFARETTRFTNTSYPSLSLDVFTSKKDGKYVVLDGVLANDVLQVSGWTYREGGGGNFTSVINDFEDKFRKEFSKKIRLIQTGRMIQFNNGWYPEYIEMSFDDHGDNTVRLWFCDDSFQKQYDDYEINVTLPIEPIDQLFGDPRHVERLLSEATTDVLVDRAKMENVGYPYTTLRSDVYDWVDRNNPRNRLPVVFISSVWGAAGDNIDSVKEATIDKILGNSDHTRDEWATILPDLFRKTEFVIVPAWELYAIPNRKLVTGLYSSNVSFKNAHDIIIAGTKGPGYTDAHIRTNASTLATTYKNLTCTVIGHHENRDGNIMLRDHYPDYLVTDPLAPEFKRMSAKTRDFVMMLVEMLKYAEEMDPNSSIPYGYVRVMRDDVLYISRSMDRVQYLVYAKWNGDLLKKTKP